MSKPRCVNPQVTRQALELRAAGLSHMQISRQLNISRTSAWRILKAHGVNRYIPREPPVPLVAQGNLSFVMFLVHLKWLGRTTTIEEIAIRVGVAEETVYRWRRTGIGSHRADLVCLEFNVLPQDVWPNWFEEDDLAA